jgi:para-nitrobenzyl esterase
VSALRLLAVAGAAGLALGLVLPGPGIAAAGAAQHHGRRAPLIVRTRDGRVRGLYNGAAREFLGIPYAAPPVGALRWRPPQPARPWTGIRNARAPGRDCAQTGSLATGVLVTSDFENCLFLNVYTPGRETGRRLLPVMVWIHGGGFTGGAGSIYDGKIIAVKGSAVVVTINYRLNAFGFLALPSLDKQSTDHSSGDYGLMDQQAALRWVRANARAFGGNPHNVTIFGESAGGASVCANMASPAARGLFQRAIAESGCVFLSQPKKQAEANGAKFAAALGCTSPATAAACLRAKPAAKILKAAGAFSWGPVTGGRTLPLSPLAAFQRGRYIHVPLLQGTNHDEGRFFVGLEFDIARGHPMTREQYPKVVAAQFGTSDAKKILAEYPLTSYKSPDLADAAVLTDAQFSCPALLTDSLTARSGVYAYEFSDPHPPNDFPVHFSFPLGAAHSTELQYVFQRIPLLDTIPPFTKAQLALSNLMIGYWTRFAATGSPNGGRGKVPHWPRWHGSAGPIQELVPGSTTPESFAKFFAFHKCGFWAAIPPVTSSTPEHPNRPARPGLIAR